MRKNTDQLFDSTFYNFLIQDNILKEKINHGNIFIEEITDITSNIVNILQINQIFEDKLSELLFVIYANHCNIMSKNNEDIIFRYLSKIN